MSAPLNTSVKKIPGELYWNPTDPDSTTASDWGTRLGNFDNLVFYIGRKSGVVVDYMLGSEVERPIALQTGRISVLFRDFDKDAWGLVFPEIATTSTPTLEPIVIDTANIAGRRSSAYAGKLFLRPKDPDYNPAVYFYNASPAILDENELPYDLVKAFGLQVIFDAFPDSDSKKMRVGNTEVIDL